MMTGISMGSLQSRNNHNNVTEHVYVEYLINDKIKNYVMNIHKKKSWSQMNKGWRTYTHEYIIKNWFFYYNNFRQYIIFLT